MTRTRGAGTRPASPGCADTLTARRRTSTPKGCPPQRQRALGTRARGIGRGALGAASRAEPRKEAGRDARVPEEGAPQAPADVAAVRETVATILADVRERGLDAVREYSRRFDGWDPPSFKVGEEEIEAARRRHRPDVLASLDFAHAQIERFARLQRESMNDFEVETRPGVFLGQRHIPVANVGAYVPGGKYPMLMSAQMSILTAKVAGVRRVVACAPPYRRRGHLPRDAVVDGASPAPTRSGASAACRRWPLMAYGGGAAARAGRFHRGARQHVRGRGQAAALRRRSASTCSPVPPRSSSSPTRRRTRSSSRPTCSGRPSTARPRRRCS